MPENAEDTTLLVTLAAEGMAEVVKGCAQTIHLSRGNGAP